MFKTFRKSNWTSILRAITKLTKRCRFWLYKINPSQLPLPRPVLTSEHFWFCQFIRKLWINTYVCSIYLRANFPKLGRSFGHTCQAFFAHCSIKQELIWNCCISLATLALHRTLDILNWVQYRFNRKPKERATRWVDQYLCHHVAYSLWFYALLVNFASSNDNWKFPIFFHEEIRPHFLGRNELHFFCLVCFSWVTISLKFWTTTFDKLTGIMNTAILLGSFTGLFHWWEISKQRLPETIPLSHSVSL